MSSANAQLITKSPNTQPAIVSASPNFKNIVIRQTARKFTARPPPPRPSWSKPAYYCDYNSHESITTSLFESDVEFSPPVLESLFFPNKFRNGYNFQLERQVQQQQQQQQQSKVNGIQEENNNLNDGWPKIISVHSECTKFNSIENISSSNNGPKPKLKRKLNLNNEVIRENSKQNKIKKQSRVAKVPKIPNGHCDNIDLIQNQAPISKQTKKTQKKFFKIRKNAASKESLGIKKEKLKAFKAKVKSRSTKAISVAQGRKASIRKSKLSNVRSQRGQAKATKRMVNGAKKMYDTLAAAIPEAATNMDNTQNMDTKRRTRCKTIATKVQKSSPSHIISIITSPKKTEVDFNDPKSQRDLKTNTANNNLLNSISSTISKCRQLYEEMHNDNKVPIKEVSTKNKKLISTTLKDQVDLISSQNSQINHNTKAKKTPAAVPVVAAVKSKATTTKQKNPAIAKSNSHEIVTERPLDLVIVGKPYDERTKGKEIAIKVNKINGNVISTSSCTRSFQNTIKEAASINDLFWDAYENNAKAKAKISIPKEIVNSKLKANVPKLKCQEIDLSTNVKPKLEETNSKRLIKLRSPKKQTVISPSNGITESNSDGILNLIMKKSDENKNSNKTNSCKNSSPTKSAKTPIPDNNWKNSTAAAINPELTKILTQSPKEKTPEITIIQNCNANNCKQLRKLRSSSGHSSPVKRSCPCECELKF